MKNGRLVRALISLVLCTVFLAIPTGNVYALPFNAAVNYAVGINPYSVAVGDFDGDGNSDLAVVNYSGHNVSILLGDGSGAFAAAVGSPVAVGGTFPTSVAVGDFDRDSDLDLAVANNNTDDVSILLGNGSGGFAAAVPYSVGELPPPLSPWAISIGTAIWTWLWPIVTATMSPYCWAMAAASSLLRQGAL